ncbi:MAG: sigma-70 family RNA polymerase sigma factor [Clostridiales bacterium]|nr:sigma-70 family RNA polymerase sigma factor [Clostridiales bacterium]
MSLNKINKDELHQLFQEFKLNNQNAYNRLYEKYFELVYGIIFSIIKNKEDTEDITHEVFTKIYKLEKEKLPTSNEASWLYTVSKNECFLYLRKQKPNINIEEVYEIPNEDNDLKDVIDIDYYNNVIKGLKEDEKCIVSLKIISDFSFSKISQIMNIPIGTVQWKYYKSINYLRNTINSLIGAIIAFIVVIITKEDMKQTKNNKKDNKIKEELEQNTNINTNINTDSTDSSEIIQNQVQDNTNKYEEYENTIVVNEVQNSDIKQAKQNNYKFLNSGFILISLIFLISSLIFLKKYQQKCKRKVSK